MATSDPAGRQPVRAILFDLDGVLVDSVDTWLGVVNEVRERLELDPIDETRLLEIFGQGVEDDVKTLYPGQEVDTIRSAYDDAMPRHVERMKAGPDARDTLRRLGERGIGRAIVTNTQATLVGDILRVADLADVVDVVVGAGGADREKPHPDMLARALRTLGHGPHEAWMVGDTAYDEDAARRAGVRYLHFDLRRGQRLADALEEVLTPA